MATFQIHPEFSREENGSLVVSATLFELDEPHDTRDYERCQVNRHTTREFSFSVETPRAEINIALQTAADEWAESVRVMRIKQARLRDLLA